MGCIAYNDIGLIELDYLLLDECLISFCGHLVLGKIMMLIDPKKNYGHLIFSKTWMKIITKVKIWDVFNWVREDT